MRTTHEFKVGDFYHCQYVKRTDMDQHAFEGLVGTYSKDGQILFYDTFWGIHAPSQYSKIFKLEDIGTTIELSFIANINDLQRITYDARLYYDDKDIIELHEQHACSKTCREYYLRNGAERSAIKIRDELEKKIYEISSKTASLLREQERLEGLLAGLDEGADIHNIWI